MVEPFWEFEQFFVVVVFLPFLSLNYLISNAKKKKEQSWVKLSPISHTNHTSAFIQHVCLIYNVSATLAGKFNPSANTGMPNKSCWEQWLPQPIGQRDLMGFFVCLFSYDLPGSKSSWQRYWEVLRVTTTTRCLRMSSLVGIWKVICVLEMRQYCWTTGWTVFTQRFLKYTLEWAKKAERSRVTITKSKYSSLSVNETVNFHLILYVLSHLKADRLEMLVKMHDCTWYLMCTSDWAQSYPHRRLPRADPLDILSAVVHFQLCP